MKEIALLLAFFTISVSTFSQGRYSVSFNTGYAISTSKDALGKKSHTFSNGDFTTSNIYGTYGAGIPFTLRVGSKINKNLRAELGFSYLLGNNVLKDESVSTSTESSTNVKGNQIRILPSLLFSGKNEALHLYSRIGLVLPIKASSKSTQITSGQDIGGGIKENIQEYEKTNAFGLGYFGALGFSFKIAENMHFFAETELINLRMKQKTSVLVLETNDGVSILSNYSTKDKEKVYVDELTSSDNKNSNEPLKLRAQTQNFSSIGLNFGIKLLF
jgi:hypothetical protein